MFAIASDFNLSSRPSAAGRGRPLSSSGIPAVAAAPREGASMLSSASCRCWDAVIKHCPRLAFHGRIPAAIPWRSQRSERVASIHGGRAMADPGVRPQLQGCLKVLPRGLASLPLHRQDSPQPRLDRLGTQPHLSLASSGVQLSGSPGPSSGAGQFAAGAAQGCLKVWAEVAAHRPCDEQDPISTSFLGAPQRGR